MRALLPPEVEIEQSRVELPADELFVEERQIASSYVPRRRAEFETARVCARRALARLGQQPAPLLRGAHNEPMWPSGVVGSITHCDGYRAAAVSHARDIATLGIDAEPHQALPGHVLDLISSSDEKRHLAGLHSVRPEVSWDRVLFSAKESVFKALYPLVGAYIDFSLCNVNLQPFTGTFDARVPAQKSSNPGVTTHRISGRWSVNESLVLTTSWRVTGRAPAPADSI